MNYFFVLGAQDKEMETIEELLAASRQPYGYATDSSGKRCHPGNAYKASGVSNLPSGEGKEFVFVECHIAGIEPAVIADHHRPGDPGHGAPPERFWEASALGQIWRLLRGDEVPEEELVYIAAADHCLAAAYRGLCPRVDPERLLELRLRQKAEFRGLPLEEIQGQFDLSCSLIKEAMRPRLHSYQTPDPRKGFWEEGDAAWEWEPEVADLRGVNTPSETPEASCFLGVPFISTVREKDGRSKIILQGVPPGKGELVKRFLDGRLAVYPPLPPLTGTYGDPERGFAGGYLS
ncbi:MAG: hypothetical protein QW299_08655 [Candidatus Caldarchaeum sp.]